ICAWFSILVTMPTVGPAAAWTPKFEARKKRRTMKKPRRDGRPDITPSGRLRRREIPQKDLPEIGFDPIALTVWPWDTKLVTVESWRSCVDRSSDPPFGLVKPTVLKCIFSPNAELLSAGGSHPARSKIFPKCPLRIDSKNHPSEAIISGGHNKLW